MKMNFPFSIKSNFSDKIVSHAETRTKARFFSNSSSLRNNEHKHVTEMNCKLRTNEFNNKIEWMDIHHIFKSIKNDFYFAFQLDVVCLRLKSLSYGVNSISSRKKMMETIVGEWKMSETIQNEVVEVCWCGKLLINDFDRIELTNFIQNRKMNSKFSPFFPMVDFGSVQSFAVHFNWVSRQLNLMVETARINCLNDLFSH